MDNLRARQIADGVDGPEMLNPGIVISGSRAEVSSTTATSDSQSSRGMSTSTSLSSPGPATLSTTVLRPLAAAPHAAITNNSPAMISQLADSMGSTKVSTSWFDIVMSPTSNTTETDAAKAARAHIDGAAVLFSLRDSLKDCPAKRSHELEIDGQLEHPVQDQKRTRYPTAKALGAEFASQVHTASSSQSSHGSISVPMTACPERTPLPICRGQIKTTPAVPEPTQGPIENAKLFSQNYVTGRGWTAINDGPQSLLRPEDDLSYPINTIIPAPHAVAARHYGRRMSAPASPSFTWDPAPARASETASQDSPLQAFAAAALSVDSPAAVLPTPPFPRSIGRAKSSAAATRTNSNTPQASCSGSGSGSGSGSNWVRISARARARGLRSAINTAAANENTSHSPSPGPASPAPAATPAPARRVKWNGTKFATLIEEALRASPNTNYTLTVGQISDHIELYRITTGMTSVALSQTIRAACLRGCSPKNRDGLWVHVPDRGKRTGRYRLL